MRYDTVFLDVDKTLLWVDLDVEGYVTDMAPYSTDPPLTVEKARGPLWESLHKHIHENVNYPTEEGLARFRRETARETARTLGLDAPEEMLAETLETRVLYNPYPESESVLEELTGMGLPLYAVSNWDVQLGGVLDSLGWLRFFVGIVASAAVGSEKPDGGIFEEALRVAGLSKGRERVVHVGNDPRSDVRGAHAAGIDAVLVDREEDLHAPEAVAVLPDLRGLPAFVVEGWR